MWVGQTGAQAQAGVQGCGSGGRGSGATSLHPRRVLTQDVAEASAGCCPAHQWSPWLPVNWLAPSPALAVTQSITPAAPRFKSYLTGLPVISGGSSEDFHFSDEEAEAQGGEATGPRQGWFTGSGRC